MKYVQSITFRALCALSIGGLLLAFPDKTTEALVIIIGILFLIPGLVSIVAYFRMRGGQESMRPIFPLVGVGSLLFGLLLMVCYSALTPYIKYVLAAFLLLASVGELVSVMRFKKLVPVSAFFFVVPLLIAVAAIFIFVYSGSNQALVSTVLGMACVVYGLEELLSAIIFRKVRRQLMQPETETPVVKTAETAGGEGEPAIDNAGETPAEATEKGAEETETVADTPAEPAKEAPSNGSIDFTKTSYDDETAEE